MAKVWNRFDRWPIQFGVALLLVGALARPAAAGTTYNVSSVAELETAIAARCLCLLRLFPDGSTGQRW